MRCVCTCTRLWCVHCTCVYVYKAVLHVHYPCMHDDTQTQDTYACMMTHMCDTHHNTPAHLGNIIPLLLYECVQLHQFCCCLCTSSHTPVVGYVGQCVHDACAGVDECVRDACAGVDVCIRLSRHPHPPNTNTQQDDDNMNTMVYAQHEETTACVCIHTQHSGTTNQPLIIHTQMYVKGLHANAVRAMPLPLLPIPTTTPPMLLVLLLLGMLTEVSLVMHPLCDAAVGPWYAAAWCFVGVLCFSYG